MEPNIGWKLESWCHINDYYYANKIKVSIKPWYFIPNTFLFHVSILTHYYSGYYPYLPLFENICKKYNLTIWLYIWSFSTNKEWKHKMRSRIFALKNNKIIINITGYYSLHFFFYSFFYSIGMHILQKSIYNFLISNVVPVK